MEIFDVDDGRPDEGINIPIWRRLFRRRPRTLLSAITLPFHVLVSLTRFVFGILRLPLPHLRFTYFPLFRSLSGPSVSRRGPDWWVRALEEETGAVCIGRARIGQTAAVSGISAGPSSLTPRFGNDEPIPTRKILPDFSMETYEEVLRTCEREARIACIILVCEEHDDVSDFKRTTLTNPAFVRLLYDNNILVWGGDVNSQDAWSASQKLQATTYPFVAFLALQPSRHSNFSTTRNVASPRLVVLSRHQGACVPSTAPTSPQTLTEHLQQQLFPRVKPFLERIRVQQRERDQERMLREEQDRAFQDSARRDRERIEARMAAERKEAEEKQARDRELRLAEERRQQELEDARNREKIRMEWRRWTRRELTPPEAEKSCKDVLKIAFRLPGDRQLRRQFHPSATLTSLYAFVDAQLIPTHLSPGDDPIAPPNRNPSSDPNHTLDEHITKQCPSADSWWGFKMVFAYPRQEIKWEAGRRLSDVAVLKGGGQIMVEMIEPIGHSTNFSDEEDSDDEDS